jgi:hypothetical protein
MCHRYGASRRTGAIVDTSSTFSVGHSVGGTVGAAQAAGRRRRALGELGGAEDVPDAGQMVDADQARCRVGGRWPGQPPPVMDGRGSRGDRLDQQAPAPDRGWPQRAERGLGHALAATAPGDDQPPVGQHVPGMADPPPAHQHASHRRRTGRPDTPPRADPITAGPGPEPPDVPGQPSMSPHRSAAALQLAWIFLVRTCEVKVGRAVSVRGDGVLDLVQVHRPGVAGAPAAGHHDPEVADLVPGPVARSTAAARAATKGPPAFRRDRRARATAPNRS